MTPVVVFVEEVDRTAMQVFRPVEHNVVVDGAGEDNGQLRALTRLEPVAEDARDFAAHAKAPNTLKAYRVDWAHFSV